MSTCISGVVKPMRSRYEIAREREMEAEAFRPQPLPTLSNAQVHAELVKLLADIRDRRIPASPHRIAALEDACIRAWCDARIDDPAYELRRG